MMELQPYVYYDEVIHQYFGGEVFEKDLLNESPKRKKKRQMIVDRTIKDLIILGKEEAMTSSKALVSIENHVKNEKLINFKQKKDQMVLMEFCK